MKFSFFTNFINHHQVPLADEMFRILGDDYKFVSFEPIPEEFIRRGYPDFSDRPYHIKGYLLENSELVEYLCKESDILLHGACSETWLQKRMLVRKTTIRYGERLFKKFDRRFIKPSFWKARYNEHTRYRNYPLYMLGASAYNRFDTALILSYPGKVFRWGYFTTVPDIDIESLIEKKSNQEIRILWCGTISQVKRPDLVPILAKRLKDSMIAFHIDMIGTGGWESLIKNQIQDLGVGDKISMLGNMPNNQVLDHMMNHDIFIFTSDYGEGWGCVLNEAMSHGCSVVTSDRAGASKFLVKNRHNGLLFKSGDSEDLFNKVMRYIENPKFRQRCAVNAYNTMRDEWSPAVAAKRIVDLSHAILKGENLSRLFSNGPCSKAPLII